MANRALLIGINRYEIPGSDLHGCVNDVKNIAAVLKRYYGFTSRSILTLTDLAATTRNIRREISRLIRGAKKGDVLLLHFSGHGSNIPDTDGDEADERDEILCPSDMDWTDALTDDELRRQFNKVRKGVNLTVTFDCCHSGTATRMIRGPSQREVPRYLPCPRDIWAAESGWELAGEVTGSRKTLRATGARARTPRDVEYVDLPEVLITGCRDYQTSTDALIKNSYNGALTYHLVKTINDARGKITYRQLHAKTKQLLRGRYDQVPQLEGRQENLDRPFLSSLA